MLQYVGARHKVEVHEESCAADRVPCIDRQQMSHPACPVCCPCASRAPSCVFCRTCHPCLPSFLRVLNRRARRPAGHRAAAAVHQGPARPADVHRPGSGRGAGVFCQPPHRLEPGQGRALGGPTAWQPGLSRVGESAGMQSPTAMRRQAGSSWTAALECVCSPSRPALCTAAGPGTPVGH